MHGWCGQADLAGELRKREPCVVAQEVDEVTIDRVHRDKPNGPAFNTANYPEVRFPRFPDTARERCCNGRTSQDDSRFQLRSMGVRGPGEPPRVKEGPWRREIVC
ncbi:hypothetical protein GCM10022255_003290 [Dactylosporangium darangshiense]|uniref:Uncharacterized protein n=1 Tax=Dactylosporangium darangshiense TaxID=579108 RepID=A0ABP8CUR5_9ACTN